MRLAARLLVPLILFALPATAAIPQPERDALVALYNGTGGPAWSSRTGWLGTPGTECSWFGITCDDAQGHVLRIELSENNLAGTIPDQIGSLTRLETFSLYGNTLTGGVPSTIRNLTQLRYLYLASNELSGTIPGAIASLANLEELYLDRNSFSGSIPSSLGSLSRLQILMLDDNDLSGPIPAGLGTLSSLRELSLGYNTLSGSIPPQLGALSRLETLRLTENTLTGPIPAQLGQLSALQILDLSANLLSGSIPASIGSLANLRELRLDRNELTGSIPDALGQLQNLTAIELSYGALSGPIPSALARLANLEELGLNDNELTGTIPKELGDLPKLRRLQIEQNMLTGAIPAELGKLSTLVDLRFSGNDISGSIPKELGSLANLEYLFLDSTLLGGGLPSELGNLAKLRAFYAGGTSLGGSIDVITRMTALEELSLDAASFGPTLPGAIGQLRQLYFLDLSDNDFAGPLPREIGQLTNLTTLDLGGCAWTGTIPGEWAALTTLQNLSLWGAELSGPIPSFLGDFVDLEYLDLYSNSFSGSIPPELGRLTKLQHLSLSENDLTGRIPAELGNLSSLRGLYVAWNALEGPLPVELGALVSLESLDAAGGFLSGAIPPELGQLTHLQYLGLSSNLFTGSIPASLTQLSELRELWLDDNALEGSVPAGIGQLANLEVLSLGYNSLTGAIPAGLTSLTKLVYLSLSGNRFEGLIPATFGQLTSLRELWLEANMFSGEVPASLSNLVNIENGYLSLRYNALFTSNASLRNFLDQKHGGAWDETQTITPTNVKVAAPKGRSVVLSWTPIAYNYDDGGYQIEVANSASGPFAVATMTGSKGFAAEVVEDLTPLTTYYFRLRAITWAHEGQQNDLVSPASAVVSATTTAAVPGPAAVVVYYYPYGMIQNVNETGAEDGYTITNVGDVATTITLSQSGNFFTQSPASVTLGPGDSEDVRITATAQPAGAYGGSSIPSGAGVPAGMAIPIRLLSVAPSTGDVTAGAEVNRIDVAAPPGVNPTGSVKFTNAGTGTLVGIAIANAGWIVPSGDLISIPPGGSLDIPFAIDRAQRPDAAGLSGTATGQLSLVYAKAGTEATKALREALNGTPPVGVGTTVVMVADTVVPSSGSSTIPPLPSGDVALFIPGAGHVTSGAGLFISDLSLTNAFGIEPLADMRMFFTPAADYPSATTLVTVGPIQPAQGVNFANVVSSALGQPERVGTLQLRSRDWNRLSINATVFNVSDPRGTYGNTIPLFRSDRTLMPGESLYITGLRKDADIRTNLFVQETSGASAAFTITFLGPDGTLIPLADGATSLRGNAAPFQMVRSLNQVPAGALTARVANDGPGRLVAYATPVDGLSRDTWSLVDWSVFYRSDPSKASIIPVAGSLRGANNNFFRTDVAFTNSSTQHGRAKLEYFKQGGGKLEKTIELGPGRSQEYADIIGALFGSPSTLGFIRVTPLGGRFLATSRTYATVDGVEGTFGMGVPTIEPAAALRLGQSKVIGNVEIASNEAIAAKSPGTFRTNIGVAEIDGKPATVRITLSAVDTSTVAYTATLATLELSLAPNEFRQFSIRNAMLPSNPGSLRNVAVTFRVVSGSGGIVAYTSSVDNGTSDSTLRLD